MFYRSLTPVEQEHVAQAYAFELGKCYEVTIRQRQVNQLAKIDATLAATVADMLGLPAPEAEEVREPAVLSPAVSQLGKTWPLDGRNIGIVLGRQDAVDVESINQLRQTIHDNNMVPVLIAPNAAPLPDGTPVKRTSLLAATVRHGRGMWPPRPETNCRVPPPTGVPAASIGMKRS